MHDRVLKSHAAAGPVSRGRLRDSIAGNGERVQGNGLGFDCTRLGSLADQWNPWIEPVIKLLAFFGLAVFRLRGRGIDRWRVHRGKLDQRQRAWRRPPGARATSAVFMARMASAAG